MLCAFLVEQWLEVVHDLVDARPGIRMMLPAGPQQVLDALWSRIGDRWPQAGDCGAGAVYLMGVDCQLDAVEARVLQHRLRLAFCDRL